jgi:hypothetical protein
MTTAACAEVIDDAIYMFGGVHCTNGEPCRTNALWKLHKTGRNQFQWSQVEFEKDSAQPSPRIVHASWEYEKKLWIYGGSGLSLDGNIQAHSPHDFDFLRNKNGTNNQLWCFDPSSGAWIVPDTTGTIPPPCHDVEAARIGDKVWLHTCDASMYMLDMRSLVWSKVETPGVEIFSMGYKSFTAITDSQIVLHGGYDHDCQLLKPGQNTWIFNIESGVWNKYIGSADLSRHMHTAVKGGSGKSVMVLGGTRMIANGYEHQVYDDIYWIRLEPDSLQKQAMKVLCENRNKSRKSKRMWKKKLPCYLEEAALLPPALYADLMEMCDDREDRIRRRFAMSERLPCTPWSRYDPSHCVWCRVRYTLSGLWFVP